MNKESESIILIDLPTFPKGVISLSLLAVAGSLSRSYAVKIVDLNLSLLSEYNPSGGNVVMVG
jgi:hypothetical protein